MALHISLFVIGLIILTVGADMLVRGSSRLALSLGIRPIVVGLTVIAFGTSCPEFFVSFTSAIQKSEGIAIGNVVGSNVANVGLVVGASALLKPLAADRTTLTRELPFMLLVSFLFLGFAWDGSIARYEGGILFAGIILFSVVSVVLAMRGGVPDQSQDEMRALKARGGGNGRNLGLAVLGLIALVGGAQLMIKGAIFVATEFNIPDVIIGLSIVAVGTSLPELAASMTAAARGEADLSLGNVIGSNIFNLLFVIGAVALIAPLPVDPVTITQQIPIMIGFSLALAFFMATGKAVQRWEGILLLLAYVGFIVWAYI